MFEKLLVQPGTQALEQHNATPHTGLDLSLLLSDPPDGTELRQANALYNSEMQKAKNIPTPVKRYIARLTQAFEATCSKNATLRKENTEQRALLKIRKRRATGKRVALNGRFVFSTQEVLDRARNAEKATVDKRTRTRRRKRPVAVEIEEQVMNHFRVYLATQNRTALWCSRINCIEEVVGWQTMRSFCACAASPRFTLSYTLLPHR